MHRTLSEHAYADADAAGIFDLAAVAAGVGEPDAPGRDDRASRGSATAGHSTKATPSAVR